MAIDIDRLNALAPTLFPEVFDGVRRQEMIDVFALPAWAGG